MSIEKVTKNTLEALIAEMDDDRGMNDLDIEAELRTAGINLAAARPQLDAALARVESAGRRRKLDRARRERLSHGSRDRLAEVRAGALSLADLHARIQRLGAQVAHRDLEGRSREDLESQLADLLALDDTE